VENVAFEGRRRPKVPGSVTWVVDRTKDDDVSSGNFRTCNIATSFSQAPKPKNHLIRMSFNQNYSFNQLGRDSMLGKWGGGQLDARLRNQDEEMEVENIAYSGTTDIE